MKDGILRSIRRYLCCGLARLICFDDVVITHIAIGLGTAPIKDHHTLSDWDVYIVPFAETEAQAVKLSPGVFSLSCRDGVLTAQNSTCAFDVVMAVWS